MYRNDWVHHQRRGWYSCRDLHCSFHAKGGLPLPSPQPVGSFVYRRSINDQRGAFSNSFRLTHVTSIS
ncbi:hypothetical protein CKO51_15085 [Rhodopirellula sp. SM50]|nr:hypothetical protein CKO51_15085 [Rhodopirellula sp. SM50]